MKLALKNEKEEKKAVFSLRKDSQSEDIDILCNDQMVAFFTVNAMSKVTLHLVDGVDESIFDTVDAQLEVVK